MTGLDVLLAHLEGAATGLSDVTKKRMFGCDALFANGNIFGLVWKHGRIGVKLPDAKLYDDLLGKKGAAPWKAGQMTMSHWVLVPEGFHGDARALGPWVKNAHRLALETPAAPAKKKGAPKKTAPAKKKAAAKKKTGVKNSTRQPR